MNKELYLLALRHREKSNQYHKIKNWYGRKSTSYKTKYICYICDSVIDTESAKYPQTKHALKAIEKHAKFHIETSLLALF